MSCIKDAFDVTYLLSSVHAVPNIYVIWCGIRLWAQPYLFASGILWSSFDWMSNCACAGLPLWKHLLKRVPFVKIHQDPTELSICKQNESKAFCKNREKKNVVFIYRELLSTLLFLKGHIVFVTRPFSCFASIIDLVWRCMTLSLRNFGTRWYDIHRFDNHTIAYQSFHTVGLNRSTYFPVRNHLPNPKAPLPDYKNACAPCSTVRSNSDAWAICIRAPSSEFVSSSIPSWQISTAHAQPFRGARDLVFCLKVPLDSLLVWVSSEVSGDTARMHRLAWTFAARIGDKYQIRLTRSIFSPLVDY